MKGDRNLVRQVKEGNKRAFSELVVRHQKAIMRLALRLTRDVSMAEDVVQDSFVKAYQKIDSFEERSSFKSWLYQIALNTARNKLRSLKRETVSMEHFTLAIDSAAEVRLLHRHLSEEIQKEIALLPDRQRLALRLRIFDDLSFKEIAEIMDCPYDTAKANYRHGLMKLRHRMEESMKLTESNYKGQFLTDVRKFIAEAE